MIATRSPGAISRHGMSREKRDVSLARAAGGALEDRRGALRIDAFTQQLAQQPAGRAVGEVGQSFFAGHGREAVDQGAGAGCWELTSERVGMCGFRTNTWAWFVNLLLATNA